MVKYVRQAQSGRSMIEMLGVLAIVGVLSAGGIAGYSMAMQSYKTSALIEKINLLAQQARILYEGQYDNAAVGTELIRSGMVTDLASPFGGVLDVTSEGASASAVKQEFKVQTNLSNIPAEACIKLLQTDWGTTGVFTSIQVTGGTEYTSAAGTSPVSGETATSQCSGGNKQMTWVFK